MHGPIVNLNGETRESLIAKHVAVYEAAQALRQALANAAPHGRDYQTSTDSPHRADRKEWAEHTSNVFAIEHTYRLIAERLATE